MTMRSWLCTIAANLYIRCGAACLTLDGGMVMVELGQHHAGEQQQSHQAEPHEAQNPEPLRDPQWCLHGCVGQRSARKRLRRHTPGGTTDDDREQQKC